MIDTVQTNVLMLALDLQGELGPGHEEIDAIPREQVERSVINIIYGGHNVIADQASNSKLSCWFVSKGDLASLEVALAWLGVEKAEVRKLPSAIEADKTDDPQKTGIGLGVGAWIADIAVKVAGERGEAGLDVAKAEAIKRLTPLVGQFLGG